MPKGKSAAKQHNPPAVVSRCEPFDCKKPEAAGENSKAFWSVLTHLCCNL